MPKRVNKQEKMDHISAAALKVFRKNGYHNTKMADIAIQAGVGKGTLYEYFKNKVDILRYAINQYFHTFTTGALQSMQGKTDPVEKLLTLVDFALQHATEWEDHCAIYIDYFGEARTQEKDRFYLTGIYDEMEFIVKAIVEEGQAAGKIDSVYDPAAIAVLLVSLYEGFIMHDVFKGERRDRDMLRETTIMFIKNGLQIGRFNHREKNKGKMR